MKEIAANPHAEVAWYFTETREQFRLAGKLDIVDASSHNEELNKTRQGQWSYMSDALRQQFTWPEPGQPVATDPEAWTRPAPSKEEIPDEFVLLVLNVEEVEYLLLGDPHRKVHYIRNAAGREGAPEWAEAPVNP
ncbi:hypothetical protein HYH03_015825 [Edaphochlamys debaryana]|uniref:Pyridoxamine 5'-phosphate oxidase Alr4036 family FMN-binding domain-containing protein n=1 Tax=Edaphochlamys debaryana TaxID=47281 RepID=A0A835XIQ4_9CHLO|nr:hypothetical protein HYH03_015825 [Edaphochlamys debaryana]|eukprot:KAG2485447.1 hypothetical protein HYH03_015825 [Edaphochlamys debaryana]